MHTGQLPKLPSGCRLVTRPISVVYRTSFKDLRRIDCWFRLDSDSLNHIDSANRVLHTVHCATCSAYQKSLGAISRTVIVVVEPTNAEIELTLLALIFRWHEFLEANVNAKWTDAVWLMLIARAMIRCNGRFG